MKRQVNVPLVRQMASSHIFKIMFVNQGKVYEVYARKVGQGRLFGFIEVEGLVFGTRSAVLLDPGEEKIKGEFEGVSCTMLPMHSILRIDEDQTKVERTRTKRTEASRRRRVARGLPPDRQPGEGQRSDMEDDDRFDMAEVER